MAYNTSQAPDLLELGVRRVLFNEFARQPDHWKSIINLHGSVKHQETDTGITGLGLLIQVTELQPTNYEEPDGRYSKVYTHAKYKLGFMVSEEMRDDDLYGVINKMSSALARSAANTVNTVVASVYNNGFTAGAYAGPDTKALFASDHPLTGSASTGTNLVAAAALSETTLQTALNRMEKTVDDKNQLVVCLPKTLLVPTELQYTAQKLLNSTLSPENANNNINALRMKNLGWMPNPYLSSATAFFLLGDQHEVNMFLRKAFMVKSTEDFDLDAMKFAGNMRFSVGFSDYRGVVGCAGA